MKPQPGSTVDTVRDFWQAHINNEYYTDADHLPEQEIVPAQALAGLGLEHGPDELGIEDARPPEPVR